MKFDPKKYHRRSIRLSGYDYSQAGAYFITFCTHQRQSLLGQVIDGQMVLNAAGQAVWEVWEMLPGRFPTISLGDFTVMPNHVHGIIIIDTTSGAGQVLPKNNMHPSSGRGAAGRAPEATSQGAASSAPTLGQIMRAFKSISAITVNRLLGRSGQSLWQRNYYEHVIRDEKSLNRIREYIMTNPLRWHLDRENPHSTGVDDFDKWLAKFKTKPLQK
ncbi:MAG: transposase [Desulfobacca sp.]|nr:transposase [Desulfobacca sp.]